ncbi:hypothetical protein L195_g038901, partial [Trifolium pratense]
AHALGKQWLLLDFIPLQAGSTIGKAPPPCGIKLRYSSQKTPAATTCAISCGRLRSPNT